MTKREKQILAGELIMLNAVMNAANEELERRIEKLRRADKRCVECGHDLIGRESEEGDTCDNCYMKLQSERLDERRGPDELDFYRGKFK